MNPRSVLLLQDLLQPQNSDLLIREGDAGVFVAGVHEVEVGSVEDCLHLLQIGERNRSGPKCWMQPGTCLISKPAMGFPCCPIHTVHVPHYETCWLCNSLPT